MTATAGVALEPFGWQHADQTFAWVKDAELRRAMNYSVEPDRDAHTRWVERMIGQPVFAILYDGRHVGNCALKDYDREARSALLWIYIGRAADRQQRVGEAALRALLRYGFENMALQRIWLYLLDFNQAASNFYCRCGFVEEGRLRRHVALGGQLYDAIYLAMLREEWTT